MMMTDATDKQPKSTIHMTVNCKKIQANQQCTTPNLQYQQNCKFAIAKRQYQCEEQYKFSIHCVIKIGIRSTQPITNASKTKYRNNKASKNNTKIIL